MIYFREEAINKARSLNIPQSCFKTSKGWAIGFMCRMGLTLRRRTTIYQKKCCISNALDGPKMSLYGRTMLKIKMIVTGGGHG
jgi:hypothetical protein